MNPRFPSSPVGQPSTRLVVFIDWDACQNGPGFFNIFGVLSSTKDPIQWSRWSQGVRSGESQCRKRPGCAVALRQGKLPSCPQVALAPCPCRIRGLLPSCLAWGCGCQHSSLADITWSALQSSCVRLLTTAPESLLRKGPRQVFTRSFHVI